MGALAHQTALVQHQDLVCVQHGGDALCHDDDGGVVGLGLQGAAQGHVGLVVQGRETVVEQINFRFFGDGAGAAVLAASEEPGIISTHLHADGSYGELLTLPNADRVNPENSIHLTMAGNEVFKVAVTELAHIVDETLAANNLDRSQLDWLVPHQANLRIISATAKKLGMSMDNVVVTLDRHGNTSAASVPCALDEAVRDGRIKPGQLVLLEAFGGGFTWGSALVRF